MTASRKPEETMLPWCQFSVFSCLLFVIACTSKDDSSMELWTQHLYVDRYFGNITFYFLFITCRRCLWNAFVFLSTIIHSWQLVLCSSWAGLRLDVSFWCLFVLRYLLCWDASCVCVLKHGCPFFCCPLMKSAGPVWKTSNSWWTLWEK
jgi:hypothetical protein